MTDDEAREQDLTPANENPWYIMMTLYGEQDGDEVDQTLARQNMLMWNSWISQDFTEEERVKAAKDIEEDPSDLIWTEDKQDEAARLFEKRRAETEASFEMPQPNHIVDMADCFFAKRVFVQHYIFPAFDSEGSHFEKGCDFSYSVFVGQVVDFNHVTFGGPLSFIGAEVEGMIFFGGSAFKHDVSFMNSRFKDTCHFGGVSFGEMGRRPCLVDFTNCVFRRSLLFVGGTFASHLPILDGASIAEDVSVTAHDVFWPPVELFSLRGPKWIKSDAKPDLSTSRDSAARLRHAMTQQSLSDEAHFFFRREMHFTARMGTFWENSHIYAYELLSDFGYSIARPANLLLTLWFLGVFLFYEFTKLGFGGAMGFSFANMFKFFGLIGTYFDTLKIEEWPGWVQWLSGAQTVLAFVLLFFLGLGLRTRFRLR